jgi:hypothetical protein
MSFPQLSLRSALALILALAFVLFLTTPLYAADSSGALFGDLFTDIAGNRSKIIQLSIVFVIVGCALLFKK